MKLIKTEKKSFPKRENRVELGHAIYECHILSASADIMECFIPGKNKIME